MGEQVQYRKVDFVTNVVDITLDLKDILVMDGNWELVAFINHKENNVVSISKEIELPMHYLNSKIVCEHCNKNSNRVKSYINVFQAIDKFTTEFELGELPETDNGVGLSKNGIVNIAIDRNEIVDYIIQSIKDGGKFVRPEFEDIKYQFQTITVRTNEGDATIDHVLEYINNKIQTLLQGGSMGYDVVNVDEVNAFNEWIDNLKIEYNGSSFSDWLVRVEDLFKHSRIMMSEVKTVVSAYGYYLKQVEKERLEKERQLGFIGKTHVGSINEKMELDLKIDSINSYVGNYGQYYIIRFLDENNNTLIYMGASNFVDDIKQGETRSFSFKIKSHNEFRGEKQTQISYVKLSV